MDRPMLEAVGVTKTFRIPAVRRHTVREHVTGFLGSRRTRAFTAVDDVTLRVSPGETVGIMGRNGCGKSTLLKMLCGIYRPDSGWVAARGRITPLLELGVGWNPQLGAIDNVLLVGTILGLRRKWLLGAVADILAFAELEAFAELQLQHYSSGMASRLAYAVAFAAVQEILVLDEIFAVGDAGFRSRCEHRYAELKKRGTTVVLVSHSPEILVQHCDRAILMDRGRLLAVGPPADIAAQYLTLAGDAPLQRADLSDA